MTQPQLRPLSSDGKAALGPKFPIRVNGWRAPEILSGLPLGDSLVQDPEMEMRARQLRWWHVVANSPGLVGAIHRLVAWQQDAWREPTLALASALRMVGWTARRNAACLRARSWPLVVPEQSYPGEILLQPVDAFALPGAVYTDGSVSQAGGGGAAAVQPDEEMVRTVRVAAPRSSTHCELVALVMALGFRPPHILTDSLAALHLLRSWGSWPTQRILQSADRMLVRQAIHLVGQLDSPPRLEKVKAHDDAAVAIGHPKAVGNNSADEWAKRAATEAGHAAWVEPGALYGDPVVLEDSRGSQVIDVRQSFAACWWERRYRTSARARIVLERLYPPDVEMAWAVSTGVFRRPVVQGKTFVHPVHPRVIKWLARVRTGCLATRSKLVGHGMVSGSLECPCCGEGQDDDEHALVGCTATGTAEWLDTYREIWLAVATESHTDVPPPSEAWLENNRFLLRAALIPVNLVADCNVPETVAPRFLALLHRALAESTAELMRRREELRSRAALGLVSCERAMTDHDAMGELEGQSLPAERRLSVLELRQAERARRVARQSLGADSQNPAGRSVVPVSGEPRQRWLRKRLVRLVAEDMLECSPQAGMAAVAVLELFERVTGEAFTDTPGTLLGNRVRAVAKVLGNITREEVFDPPLTQLRRRGWMIWNRKPTVAVDVAEWRRRVEAEEAHAAPVLRLSEQMAVVDARLADWVCNHPYLRIAPLAVGESGMALLILWEVDHRQVFPSRGGEGLTAALQGFTKRLAQCVARDPRLAWLECGDVHASLARGLAPSHHKRWTVKLVAPAATEPQGWYEDFLGRWGAYVRALVCPPGSRPMSEVTPEQLTRIRPGLQRTSVAESLGADVATSSSAVTRPVAVPGSGWLAGMPHERPGAGDSTRMGTTDMLHSRSGVGVGSHAADSAEEPGVRVESTRGGNRQDRNITQTEERPPPKKRRRTRPPTAPAATLPPEAATAQEAPALGAPTAPPPAAAQRRPRPRMEAVQPGPPPRRQRTLLDWMKPTAELGESEARRREPEVPRHGRAVESPPP